MILCASSIVSSFLFILNESPSRYDKIVSLSLSLSLSISFFCKRYIPFLVPGFPPTFCLPFFFRVTFNFWSLSFRALLSQSRSPREATRAAPIQTLHLVHYEYHDFVNLLEVRTFLELETANGTNHARESFIISVLFLKQTFIDRSSRRSARREKNLYEIYTNL